jgi:hypothetical protein
MNDRDVTSTDLLVALEGLKGEVKGMRGELTAHMLTNKETRTDHEKRLRQTERSIQQGRGAITFLGLALAAMGSLGAYISSFIERS